MRVIITDDRQLKPVDRGQQRIQVIGERFIVGAVSDRYMILREHPRAAAPV
jgi:hypothetical protein